MRLWLPAALLLAACGLPDSDYFGEVGEVRDPGHLRFCNYGEPESLDPATASSTSAMKPIYELFDGLTTFDADGNPEPSIAERWEVSPDQRVFTFHLHDRARFSSGRPITAHDFRYHATRLLHPSTASVNAFLLQEVEHAVLYNGNAVRRVLRDQGALRAGEVVEVLAVDGAELAVWRKERKRAWPDSNERRGSAPLRLRDQGADPAEAYATAPAGAAVTVIELTGDPLRPDADTWAYVYRASGDGVYGWVRWSELDVAPNDDAVYTVRRLPKTDGAPTFEVRAADLLMLPDVVGIEVPDDRTIVYRTTHPTPWFIAMSPNRAFRATPREVVSRWPRRWTDVGRIVTSGPLHLTGWYQRDRLELVRSQTYWDPGEVKLDRLTIYSIDDQAASANLYYTGRCDVVTTNHIPASYTAGLRRYKDYHLDPWLGTYFIQFQTEKLSSRHLRRAMSLAVDRTAFPDLLDGNQVPTAALSPGKPAAQLTDDELALCGIGRDHPGVAMIMVPGELCYVPPRGLDFDPAAAREELRLAREELGDPGYPGTLTFTFNTLEQNKLIAEHLQHQWREVLGLDITLQVQEWKTYLADTKNGNFQLGRFGWIANFPDTEGEFLPLYRCGSPNNRSRYCSESFDGLVEAARMTTDRKLRLEKVKAAEEIVLGDAPLIPLFVYTQAHLVKPYVRDLELNLVDQLSLHKAWLDPAWKP